MDYCERLISDPKHDWVVRAIKIMQVENKLEICGVGELSFCLGSNHDRVDMPMTTKEFLSFFYPFILIIPPPWLNMEICAKILNHSLCLFC